MAKVINVIGQDVGAGKRIEETDLEHLLYLLDVFVDQDHECKEEFALFPVVMRRISQETFKELQARQFEHNQERSLIEGLREALKTRKSGDLAYCSTRLAEFLTDHLRKEYLLFKDLEKLLTPDDDRGIVEEFTKIDLALAPKLQDALSRLDPLTTKYSQVA